MKYPLPRPGFFFRLCILCWMNYTWCSSDSYYYYLVFSWILHFPKESFFQLYSRILRLLFNPFEACHSKTNFKKLISIESNSLNSIKRSSHVGLKILSNFSMVKGPFSLRFGFVSYSFRSSRSQVFYGICILNHFAKVIGITCDGFTTLLKVDSIADFFLWILQNILGQLSSRTPLDEVSLSFRRLWNFISNLRVVTVFFDYSLTVTLTEVNKYLAL